MPPCALTTSPKDCTHLFYDYTLGSCYHPQLHSLWNLTITDFSLSLASYPSSCCTIFPLVCLFLPSTPFRSLHHWKDHLSERFPKFLLPIYPGIPPLKNFNHNSFCYTLKSYLSKARKSHTLVLITTLGDSYWYPINLFPTYFHKDSNGQWAELFQLLALHWRVHLYPSPTSSFTSPVLTGRQGIFHFLSKANPTHVLYIILLLLPQATSSLSFL